MDPPARKALPDTSQRRSATAWESRRRDLDPAPCSPHPATAAPPLRDGNQAQAPPGGDADAAEASSPVPVVTIRAPSGFKRALAGGLLAGDASAGEPRPAPAEVWAHRRDSAIRQAASSANLGLSRRHQLREIKSSINATTDEQLAQSYNEVAVSRRPGGPREETGGPQAPRGVDFEMTLPPNRTIELERPDLSEGGDSTARARSTSAPVQQGRQTRVRMFPPLRKRVSAAAGPPNITSPTAGGGSSPAPWNSGAGHRSRGYTDVRERHESQVAAVQVIEYPRLPPKKERKRPLVQKREKVGPFDRDEPVVGWAYDEDVASDPLTREDWDVQEEVEELPPPPPAQKLSRRRLQQQQAAAAAAAAAAPSPVPEVLELPEEERLLVHNLVVTLASLVGVPQQKRAYVDERIELASVPDSIASLDDVDSENSLPPWVSRTPSTSSLQRGRNSSSSPEDGSPVSAPEEDTESSKPTQPPPEPVLYTLPPNSERPVPVKQQPSKTRPDAPPVVIRWARR